MVKTLLNVIGVALISTNVFATETITAEQIRQVIRDTDAASNNRDTQAIGVHLASDFYKYIDISKPGMPDDAPDAARLDKYQYLDLIDKGWTTIDDYNYQRIDIRIHIAANGLSGESSSTVIETMTTGGKKIVSKVREYALYKLENGRPVIFNVESHTLVGDTTPE